MSEKKKETKKPFEGRKKPMVTKPAVSGRSLPTHETKVPEPKLPGSKPKLRAPEPEDMGFKVVDMWHSYEKCVCSFCGAEILTRKKALEHVLKEHITPKPTRLEEHETGLVDSNDKPITKLVEVPIEEDKENG